LGDCSDEEKFLFANAAAALLLRQLLDEGVRSLREMDASNVKDHGTP
jgi:hypothetical protein